MLRRGQPSGRPLGTELFTNTGTSTLNEIILITSSGLLFCKNEAPPPSLKPLHLCGCTVGRFRIT